VSPATDGGQETTLRMSEDSRDKSRDANASPDAFCTSGDLGVPEAPDLIAPVLGFRDWRVIDGRLCSPRTGVVWSERVMHADCRPRSVEDFVRPPHAAPAHDCTCGIHAYYEPSEEASIVDWRGVSGIVAVWGRLEAHAAGMRAEWARVEALAVYARWTRRQKEAVRAVADGLGVDVIDLRDVALVAPSYADPLPDQFVPGAARVPRPRFLEPPTRRLRVASG
jgi:hypothetical protein